MEKELRNLLRCCAVFGLCLAEYDGSAKSKWRNYLYSAVVHCYPIGIALFVSHFYLVATHGFSPSYDIHERGLALSWVVSNIIFSTQILANLIIIAETLGKRQAHVHFQRCLAEAEERLRLRLKVGVHKRRLARKLQRTFCALFGISVLSILAFGLALQILHHSNYLYNSFYTAVSMRLRLIQIWVYVQLVCAYMRCLNRKLQQLLAGRTARQGQLLDVADYANWHAGADQVRLLVAIRETYGLLHAAVQCLNDFAGWSLFTILCCYTLDYTCHIYWWLLTLDEMLPSYTYITSVSTLLPLGVIVCRFCAACNACKCEGMRCLDLISKLLLLAQTPAERQRNAVIADILLQLQHQRIQLTAQHFFNLELKLLMTISVAIATYLVILIQFLESDATL